MSAQEVARDRRYPGANSFEDSEAYRKLFFGRKKEKARLWHQVIAHDLVVVFGESGYGKSSLIKAGLLQPLRERGYFPVVSRVFRVTKDGDPVEPASIVYSSFKAEAEKRCADSEMDYRHGDEESLWHFLKTQEVWSGSDLLKPVLILDQFEELFTLMDEDPRKDFIGQLTNVVQGRPPKNWEKEGIRSGAPPKVKIVLVLRSDALAELEGLADTIPQILRNRFRVGPLDREQANSAIVRPADYSEGDLDFKSPAFRWEDGTLEEVLDYLCERGRAAQKEEVDPSQLQLICHHVENQVIREDELLKRTDPVARVQRWFRDRARARTGTSDGMIEADKALVGKRRDLEKIQRKFYSQSIKRVAEAQPGSSLRNRRRYRDLCEDGLINEGLRTPLEQSYIRTKYNVSEGALDALVNCRLLRLDARKGYQNYELSHDTLVHPILSALKRRRKRQRILMGVTGAAALFAGVVMWQDQRESRIDDHLLSQAQVVLSERRDPGTAALILRGVENKNRPLWRQLVSQIYSKSPPRHVWPDHTMGVRDLVVGSLDAVQSLERMDVPVAVSGGEDGTLVVRSLPEGEVLFTRSDPGAAVRVVAAGGRWVLWGTADGRVGRWDATTNTFSEARIHGEQPVRGVAISPDGHQASVGSDGRLHVRFLDGSVDSVTVNGGAAVTALAFGSRESRGEKYVVVGDATGDVTRWTIQDASLVAMRRRPVFLDGVPPGADRRIRSLQYDPSGGGFLLVVSRSLGARIFYPEFDAGTGLARGAASEASTNDVIWASFNADGGRALVLHEDGAVRMLSGRELDGTWYGVRTTHRVSHPGAGKPVGGYRAATAEAGSVRPVAQAVTARSDGSVKVWPFPSRADSLEGRPLEGEEIIHGKLSGVAVSRDGEWLAAGNLDGVVTVWGIDDIFDSKLVSTAPLPRFPASPLQANDTVMSKDGLVSAVITAVDEGLSLTWQVREDSAQAADLVPAVDVAAPVDVAAAVDVAAPESPSLLARSGSATDSASAPPEAPADAAGLRLRSASINSDSTWALGVTTGGLVLMADLETEGIPVSERLDTLRAPDGEVLVAAFGHDSRSVVALTDRAVLFWSRADPADPSALTHRVPAPPRPDEISRVSASSDHAHLFAASESDDAGWLWAVETPDAAWIWMPMTAPTGLAPGDTLAREYGAPGSDESRSGEIRATGERSAFTVVFEEDGVQGVKTLGNVNSANTGAINEAGDRAVVGYWDVSMVHHLYSEDVDTLRSPGGQVQAVNFAPGTNEVVTVTESGVQVWTPVRREAWWKVWDRGRERYTQSLSLQAPTGARLNGAAMSPGGEHVFLFREDRPLEALRYPITSGPMEEVLEEELGPKCLNEALMDLYLDRSAHKRFRCHPIGSPSIAADTATTVMGAVSDSRGR